MRRTSRRSGVLGLVEVMIGASCLVIPVILHGWLVLFCLLIYPLGALLFVAMTMLLEGIGNLVKSWKCSGFE